MKQNNVTTVVVKSAGVLFCALLMGFGISMFYTSGLGSDPISTFIEAIAVIFGLQSGTASILVNLIVVAIFFFIRRRLINIGTFIQTFCVGTGINLGMGFWHGIWPESAGLVANIAISIIGAVLIGVSIALYLPLDIGASPNDILVLTTCDVIHKSYKWGFYTVYAIFLTTGILLGGVWGVGTIIAMVVTGLVTDLLLPPVRKLATKIFREPAAVG